MAPTLRHPFIDGLKDVPQDRKKELNKIKIWLNSQAHLPHFSDDYIYLFLHSAFYNVDKAKDYIESYCTIRANAPIIFNDRDVYSPRMQLVLKMANLIRLPKTTPEGYRVLLYSVKDPDPTKMVFSDAVKGFCMYNDCILSEDGLAEGYIVIFDMRGVCIGHLARVSLPALKAFMYYIQEAHPCRLKGVHILNTASWIHHIMRIVLPLVKSEILGMVKFHKGIIPEGVPQDILPADYGGEAPSVLELDIETKNMVDKYAEWLKESTYFKADETKRVKKASWWSMFTGSNQQPVDEKTILKNLQID